MQKSFSFCRESSFVTRCVPPGRFARQVVTGRGIGLKTWTKRGEEREVVVKEELMIAKKALQKCLKKVELAMELGDPADIVVSQAEIFQNVLKQQTEFLEKERSLWEKEKIEWKRQEVELRNEIYRLRNLLETKKSNLSWNEQKAGENFTATEEIETRTGDLENKAVQLETKTGVLETKTEEVVKAAEEKGFVKSVQASIASAIAAVETGDVLSEEFNGVLVNGESGNVTSEDDEVVEIVKSPPTGPPPTLNIGDDDIYWVSQLHEALNQKGFYCGDDDVEDFYFGDGTVSALLTYQACNGLEETGITDQATWTSLLGAELKPVIGSVSQTEHTKEEQDEVKKEETPARVDFPVLSEFSGGKDVHCYQVMLEIAGYSCGKDDMEWWHYGDDTIAATKTFQACNGLPESGVADVSTWKKLIGDGKTMGDVIVRVQQEKIYEEDMSKTDRVWLLGEQRWERKL